MHTSQFARRRHRHHVPRANYVYAHAHFFAAAGRVYIQLATVGKLVGDHSEMSIARLFPVLCFLLGASRAQSKKNIELYNYIYPATILVAQKLESNGE